MKNILNISLLLCICFGISTSIVSSEKIPTEDEKSQIYHGEYISYIHLVFNDFVKTEVIPNGRNLKIHSKIMFYEFMIEEKADIVTIRIGYNHALVREKFAVQIKDGGAEYQLKKGTLVISKNTSYK